MDGNPARPDRGGPSRARRAPLGQGRRLVSPGGRGPAPPAPVAVRPAAAELATFAGTMAVQAGAAADRRPVLRYGSEQAAAVPAGAPSGPPARDAPRSRSPPAA